MKRHNPIISQETFDKFSESERQNIKLIYSAFSDKIEFFKKKKDSRYQNLTEFMCELFGEENLGYPTDNYASDNIHN